MIGWKERIQNQVSERNQGQDSAQRQVRRFPPQAYDDKQASDQFHDRHRHANRPQSPDREKCVGMGSTNMLSAPAVRPIRKILCTPPMKNRRPSNNLAISSAIVRFDQPMLYLPLKFTYRESILRRDT